MPTVSGPIRLKNPFDIVGPEPIDVEYEVVPCKKPKEEPAKRHVQDRKGKEMKSRYINLAVFSTGCASCGYSVLMAATFSGIIFGLIPLWAIEKIALWWPIIALVYVLLQPVRPIMALGAENSEFVVDWYTPILAAIVVVLFLALFLVVSWPPVWDVWYMLGESAIAIAASFLIAVSSLRIHTRIKEAEEAKK